MSLLPSSSSVTPSATVAHVAALHQTQAAAQAAVERRARATDIMIVLIAIVMLVVAPTCPSPIHLTLTANSRSKPVRNPIDALYD